MLKWLRQQQAAVRTIAANALCGNFGQPALSLHFNEFEHFNAAELTARLMPPAATGDDEEEPEAEISGLHLLHLAAVGGNPALVRMLLDAGAEVASTDAHGASALFIAAQTGNLAAAEVLIKWGADVDCRTAAGGTPLLVAAEQGHTETVSLLLDRLGQALGTPDGSSEPGRPGACARLERQLPSAALAAARCGHAVVLWQLCGRVGSGALPGLVNQVQRQLCRRRARALQTNAAVLANDGHGGAVDAVLWTAGQGRLVQAYQRLAWATAVLLQPTEPAGAAGAAGVRAGAACLLWQLVSADLAELCAPGTQPQWPSCGETPIANESTSWQLQPGWLADPGGESRLQLFAGGDDGRGKRQQLELVAAVVDELAAQSSESDGQSIAPPKMLTKRARVTYLQRQCSYPFLRKHRMCGGAASVAKSRSTVELDAAFAELEGLLAPSKQTEFRVWV